jgi:hypothetical protein
MQQQPHAPPPAPPAAHFANVDQHSPFFSQERAPTSVAYAENQSMFLDSMATDAAWLGRYARDREVSHDASRLIRPLCVLYSGGQGGWWWWWWWQAVVCGGAGRPPRGHIRMLYTREYKTPPPPNNRLNNRPHPSPPKGQRHPLVPGGAHAQGLAPLRGLPGGGRLRSNPTASWGRLKT